VAGALAASSSRRDGGTSARGAAAAAGAAGATGIGGTPGTGAMPGTSRDAANEAAPPPRERTAAERLASFRRAVAASNAVAALASPTAGVSSPPPPLMSPPRTLGPVVSPPGRVPQQHAAPPGFPLRGDSSADVLPYAPSRAPPSGLFKEVWPSVAKEADMPMSTLLSTVLASGAASGVRRGGAAPPSDAPRAATDAASGDVWATPPKEPSTAAAAHMLAMASAAAAAEGGDGPALRAAPSRYGAMRPAAIIRSARSGLMLSAAGADAAGAARPPGERWAASPPLRSLPSGGGIGGGGGGGGGNLALLELGDGDAVGVHVPMRAASRYRVE